MSKKIVLPPYETMLLNLGTFTAEQLDNLVKCAKVRIAQMQPKKTRTIRPKVQPAQEKAS